ncbi:mutator type transposase [Tanacetum coccineum]
MHCVKPKGENTWYCRVFRDIHTCLQSRNVRKCIASFLAREIEQTIKPNPKIPLLALKDQIQKKYEIGVSKQKVFRAKQIAQEKVIGDHTTQYSKLRQYVLELKERNPNTTVKIDVERNYEPDSPTRKFRRIYVCWGALKSGFKAGQRDLLGLDVCFMSRPFPMQILTVVGVDPNNGIYPLAYAVVESKTKQSWLWFLDCLGDDLELFRNSNFTFVTNRQKVNILNWIIPALAETFPATKHRYCLKHIYDNMKLQWRGKLFKELLWRCATATTVSHFNRVVEEVKQANKDVYDWLKDISPQHWARSYFSGVKHTVIRWNGQAYHSLLRVHKIISYEKDCHSPADSPIILTPPDYYIPICRPPKKRKKSVAELYDGMVKDGIVNHSTPTVNVNPSAQQNMSHSVPHVTGCEVLKSYCKQAFTCKKDQLKWEKKG